MIIAYPPPIEQQMQRYYGSLSEKDRRRYAGIEAAKLGHGGIRYSNSHFKTFVLKSGFEMRFRPNPRTAE